MVPENIEIAAPSRLFQTLLSSPRGFIEGQRKQRYEHRTAVVRNDATRTAAAASLVARSSIEPGATN
jgi:hypothetical protein